jgi:hypothetical protein
MSLVQIDIGNPKTARELLCKLATEACSEHPQMNAAERMIVQNWINQLDIHRPLGVDGKHGNLHTPTCGCDDALETRFNETTQEWEALGDDGWQKLAPLGRYHCPECGLDNPYHTLDCSRKPGRVRL